jgi:hypothetical protein
MTRQRLLQLARNLKGLCAYCTNPLHPGSKSACYHHLVKQRTRMRKHQKSKPGYVSGRGRPAFTRLPQPQSDLDKAA